MESLIACLGVVGILVLVFGFLAFLRYLNYKKAITLAEKGLAKPETKSGTVFLRWGIIITALGLALSIGLYTIGFDSADNYPLHLGPWMLGGFVPLFLGIGLTLLHFFTDRD
jgi:hypothetical protein